MITQKAKNTINLATQQHEWRMLRLPYLIMCLIFFQVLAPITSYPGSNHIDNGSRKLIPVNTHQQNINAEKKPGTPTSLGAVIHIPGDQPTIQAGVNAASDDDTVLVGPGVYYENINFSGKNIVVASHFAITRDTSFIRLTIINGSRPTHPDTASCVLIVSGEDSGAVLEGFTLTGGTGTKWVDEHGAGTFVEGGGILITLSAPTIKNNVIINNEAIRMLPGSVSAGGGGIRIGDGSPLIIDNVIKNNSGMYGGGIVLNYASANIIRNIIANNIVYQAVSNVSTFGGGGIWIYSVGPNLVENNTIVGNSSAGAGSTMAGRGGAILSSQANVTIRNNIVWGNNQANGGQVSVAPATGVIYNDIEGGHQGPGNIDSDPLFKPNTFNLSENSPCIDAGDPTSPLDPDGTPADMGALFFYHLTDPWLWLNDYELDDSAGDNNGKAEAGETVNLVVTITNTSLDATGVSVELVNNDPDVQIVKSTANFGNIARDKSLDNAENPFTFFIHSSSITHYSTFYLKIMAEADFFRVDSLELLIGSAGILLVDDDNGAHYENHYTTPLEAEAIFPDTWDLAISGVPSVEILKQYQAIIWFTGDDRNTSLTGGEQTIIAAYLDGGGKLLLSGQDIGYDLVQTGSDRDSAFYADYLHARFLSDSSHNHIARGLVGDPICNGLVVNFVGNFGGAGNQVAPDVIEPLTPAQTILQYLPGFGNAGLRFDNELTGARLVYLAFGIEGIAGPQQNSAGMLLKKAMNWLTESPMVPVEMTEQDLPQTCVLHQNYPNPFNPMTTIKYSIPMNGFVILKIYNILGKELAILVNEQQNQGNHEIVFDGINWPSAVYFYQLQVDNHTATKKFIIMK